MSKTIHVELPRRCDADDFVTFLRGRGLAGTLTSANGSCELEIGYAVDPERRLRDDVEAALAGWLEESERPLVPTSDPARGYVLRPPGD